MGRCWRAWIELQKLLELQSHPVPLPGCPSVGVDYQHLPSPCFGVWPQAVLSNTKNVHVAFMPFTLW